MPDAPRWAWGWSTFAGERVRLWQSDVDGAHTSEAMFDPYSFAHACAASVQALTILPPWTGVAWQHAFLLNLGLHALFELFENTPPVVYYCRRVTVDTQYKGDSVLNSLGDLFTFAVFYALTWVLWARAGLRAAAVPPVASSIVFLILYGACRRRARR